MPRRRSTTIYKRDVASSFVSDVSTSTNTDLGMVISMAIHRDRGPLTASSTSESLLAPLTQLSTHTPTVSFSSTATGLPSSTVATSPSPAPTGTTTKGFSEMTAQILAEGSRNSASQTTDQSPTLPLGPACTPQPGGGPICHYGEDSADVQYYHVDDRGIIIIGSLLGAFFFSIALVFLVWWWIRRRNVASSAAAVAGGSELIKLPELRSIKSSEWEKETGEWDDLPGYQQ
ncbi:unnamed protein product [Periconia digitata]|uniref:Uncharacterized protein n=1 Tax=Periconia digitata TaxID=1303443 RepID=A0A9W4UFK6_9PLEO|nr:unnamed protein product [Periconia digitata]